MCIGVEIALSLSRFIKIYGAFRSQEEHVGIDTGMGTSVPKPQNLSRGFVALQ